MTSQNQAIANHYETNAREIYTTVVDDDGTTMDLTGASASYVLKESVETPDSQAAVTKTGTQGGDESQISFPDPANGSLVIHIETGDTTGVVDWSTETTAAVDLHHRLDVTDTDGNLVTTFTGSFELLEVGV
jgi:hypothetical protein